jgi:hypothetical protein
MSLKVSGRPARIPLDGPVSKEDVVASVTAASIIAGVAMVSVEPPHPHDDLPDFSPRAAVVDTLRLGGTGSSSSGDDLSWMNNSNDAAMIAIRAWHAQAQRVVRMSTTGSSSPVLALF